MSIQESGLKIKGWGRIVKDALFISLISAAMFFLGRYSAAVAVPESVPAPLAPMTDIPKLPEAYQNNLSASPDKDEKPPLDPQSEPAPQKAQTIVASKNGKTYYPSSCKSLSRIKPENRIYFATESEAVSKGLTKSKSCK